MIIPGIYIFSTREVFSSQENLKKVDLTMIDENPEIEDIDDVEFGEAIIEESPDLTVINNELLSSGDFNISEEVNKTTEEKIDNTINTKKASTTSSDFKFNETSEKKYASQPSSISYSMPYYLKVNRTQNVVNVYTKDNNGEYTSPYKVMVCSTGTATPKAGAKHKITTYRREWNGLKGGVYGQYATQIVGNILFHSVPYTAKNKGSLEYWEYDKLGTKASMGCIRLTVEDAKWIYDNVGAGTIVEFYEDENPGPLGKPSVKLISNDELCRGWDPTDYSEGNPWYEPIVVSGDIIDLNDMTTQDEIVSEIEIINENFMAFEDDSGEENIVIYEDNVSFEDDTTNLIEETEIAENADNYSEVEINDVEILDSKEENLINNYSGISGDTKVDSYEIIEVSGDM